MSAPAEQPPKRRPIRHLRWWIALVLFAMSFNNYIDRQTLSALSPYLKEQFGWTNEDYALVVNAFQISYTVMQMVANGYGITLIPEIAAAVELRDDRVTMLRFEEPQPGRSIGLVYRRTSPRKQDFAALCDVVSRRLGTERRAG